MQGCLSRSCSRESSGSPRGRASPTWFRRPLGRFSRRRRARTWVSGSGDLNRLAGLGVAALAGGTVGDRELAEAGDVDLVAIGEMPGDQLEEFFDRELGIVRFRQRPGVRRWRRAERLVSWGDLRDSRRRLVETRRSRSHGVRFDGEAWLPMSGGGSAQRCRQRRNRDCLALASRAFRCAPLVPLGACSYLRSG